MVAGSGNGGLLGEECTGQKLELEAEQMICKILRSRRNNPRIGVDEATADIQSGYVERFFPAASGDDVTYVGVDEIENQNNVDADQLPNPSTFVPGVPQNNQDNRPGNDDDGLPILDIQQGSETEKRIFEIKKAQAEREARERAEQEAAEKEAAEEKAQNDAKREAREKENQDKRNRK